MRVCEKSFMSAYPVSNNRLDNIIPYIIQNNTVRAERREGDISKLSLEPGVAEKKIPSPSTKLKKLFNLRGLLE